MRPSTIAFFCVVSLALASACGGHNSAVNSFGGHVARPGTLMVQHVPTQDNGDLHYFGGNPYPSPIARLTWVYVATPGLIATYQTLGVKVMFYTMETRVANSSGIQLQYYNDLSSPVPTNPNYAQDCSGNVIHNTTSGLYLTQPDYSTVETTYKKDWLDPTATATPDAYFFDAAGNFGDMPSAPCKDPTSQISYTEPQWIASPVAAAIATMSPRPVIYNGLTFVSTTSTSPAPEIALNSVAIGGRAEECYIRSASPNPSYDGPTPWQAFENTELKMIAASKYIVCQPNDINTDPSSADGLAHRMFAYASFLLTYDTNNKYAIYWYYSAAGASGARVMPETQVVPQNPSVAQPTDISALQVGTDVYVREYKHCYVFGTEVGSGCLVVVNVDPTNPRPLPSSSPYTYYSHTGYHRLVLHGGAWADGGWTTQDGSPAPTSLPADSGFVVFNNP